MSNISLESEACNWVYKSLTRENLSKLFEDSSLIIGNLGGDASFSVAELRAEAVDCAHDIVSKGMVLHNGDFAIMEQAEYDDLSLYRDLIEASWKHKILYFLTKIFNFISIGD